VDHHELEPLERELLRMSDAVASRVRHAGLRGRTVQLKLKLADFRILTRARTLGRFVDSATAIHTTALELLRAEDLADEVAHVGVRLLGVSLSRFDEAGVRSEGAPGEVGDDGADAVEQLGLFDPPGGAPAAPATGVEPPRDTDPRLTRAVDEIRARFGAASVGPAALADRGALRVKQPGDTQWGPSAPDPDQP
jgi:DNA polymerase-4